MIWPQKHVLPAWMLGAATATGMLAAPSLLCAQTRPIYQNGKIVQTAPASLQGQPVAPAAGAAAPSGETAVQQELRRLYAESGREMPEVPKNVQMQVQNQNLPPSPDAPSTGGTAPQVSRPVAHSQPSKKPNPVTSFFKKLVPGGQSKPQTTAAAGHQPATSAPSGAPGPSVPPKYSPFGAQPPRRLPGSNAVAAAPTAVPAAPAIPPSPLPMQGDVPVQPTVSISAPSATPVAVPTTPGPVLTAPTITTARSQPAGIATTKVAPALKVEPAFEAPVVVGNEQSPFAQTEVTTTAPAEADADQPVAMEEFPDPFTEQSEQQADGRSELAETSPFQGLTLEAEPGEDSNLAGQDVLRSPAVESPSFAQQSRPVVISTTETAGTAANQILTDAPVLPMPSIAPLTAPVTEAPQDLAPVDAGASGPDQDAYEAKMGKVRERGGMKGLKGFCPVLLRDERELKDAAPQFQSNYRGQKFHFSSEEAKEKFDADPPRYAPAAYGADIVVLVRDKDVAEGTLDYAAWFKGRLYLFATEDAHNTFVADPAKFATQSGIE